MNPISYCENKVAPRGSSFYYSIRSLSSSKREAIIAIKAFYIELLDCLYDCQEVSLARIRLQWWRDEIDRAYTQQASHPVAVVLTRISQQIDKKQFYEIINGIESYLDHPIFETQQELFHFLSRTVGLREWIIAQIIGPKDYKIETFLQFGAGIETIHHLRNLHYLIQKGFFFFPQTSLDNSSCSLEELAKLRMTPPIQSFVEQQAKQAKNYLQNKINLPYFSPYQQLMLALINDIELDHYQVLQHYIKINPIRKLWISWRHS